MAKTFQNLSFVVKFRQIWSHCWLEARYAENWSEDRVAENWARSNKDFTA